MSVYKSLNIILGDTLLKSGDFTVEGNTVTIKGTGTLQLPSGTTVERPVQKSGMVRYNTQLDTIEAYVKNAWRSLDQLADSNYDTYIEVEQLNNNSDTIRIVTANTERMTILPTGEIGIGTTSPSCALDINGNTNTTSLSLDGGDITNLALSFNNATTKTGVYNSATDLSILREDTEVFKASQDTITLSADNYILQGSTPFTEASNLSIQFTPALDTVVSPIKDLIVTGLNPDSATYWYFKDAVYNANVSINTGVPTTESLEVLGNIKLSADTNKLLDNTGNNLISRSSFSMSLGSSNLDDTYINSPVVYMGEPGSSGAMQDPGTATLILENFGSASLQILSPDTGASYIEFGDTKSPDIGMIVYDHSIDSMELWAGGSLGISTNANATTVHNNLIVTGDLTLNGTTTVVNSTDLNVTDNIITLNSGETGTSVTAGIAGIEIDRGTSQPYRIEFEELTGNLKTGLLSDLRSVARCEDSPVSSGIAVWESAGKFFRTIPGFTHTGSTFYNSAGYNFSVKLNSGVYGVLGRPDITNTKTVVKTAGSSGTGLIQMGVSDTPHIGALTTGALNISGYTSFITEPTPDSVLAKFDFSLGKLTLRPKTGQTGNVQEWALESGTAISAVNEKGDFGIGTTAPTTRLHIKGAVNDSPYIYLENYGGSSAGVKYNDEVNFSLTEFASGTARLLFSNTGSGGHTHLKAKNTLGDVKLYTGGVERLTVANSGNVGVGNPSPSYALDVAGSLRVASNSTTGFIERPDGSGHAVILRSTGTDLQNSILNVTDTTGAVTYFSVDTNTSKVSALNSDLYVDSNKHVSWGDGSVYLRGDSVAETLSLYTSNTEHMKLQADGTLKFMSFTNGKVIFGPTHDNANYLRYDELSSSASAGFTIRNQASGSNIAFKTGGAERLRIEDTAITASEAIVAPRLELSNPGTGNTSELIFNKTNDYAGIRVTETSLDATTFQFYLGDNPDQLGDRFSWYMDDWQGAGGDWEPLVFAGRKATLDTTNFDVTGEVTLGNAAYFSSGGVKNSIYESKTGTLSITHVDLTGYVSNVFRLIYIEITGTGNTFSVYNNPTKSQIFYADLPISTTDTTVGPGITIRWSGTTGGVAGDVYSFGVWPKGTVKVNKDAYLMGKVGIGTTTPTTNLHITGTGKVTELIQSSGADVEVQFNNTVTSTNWTLGIDSSDADAFKLARSTDLGTTTYWTVNSSGETGIGTTPKVGYGLATTGMDVYGPIHFSGGYTLQSQWDIIYSSATGKQHYFRENSTNIATISSAGGVKALNGTDYVQMVHNGTTGNLQSSNNLNIFSSAGYTAILSNASYVQLQSAAANPMYFDCGAQFKFRDEDSANAEVVTIESSTGDITSQGFVDAKSKVAASAFKGKDSTNTEKFEIVWNETTSSIDFNVL